MAAWSTITVKFDIFEPLLPPIESALQALEAVEAILEAVLALLKPFFLDLTNPLRALMALLLAAVRALINQIRSTGFSVLLVHPDFSQPDFSGVLYSVSGAYPAFESKVVGKFYDSSDEFRPQYPPGSSVAMLVFYLGADSPGDLMGLLFSLLSLIRHPVNLSGLPAPVDLKAVPVNQSGSSVSQFRQLFDPGLKQALQLEWRMPQSASGMSSQGFAGQAVSLYNQFRFPNFVVERTGPFPQDEGDPQLSPQGETVMIPVSSQTIGSGVVDGIAKKYSFPAINSLSALREVDGSVYKHFPTRIPIQFGADGQASAGVTQGSSNSALAQTASLVTGIATGRYKFLDEGFGLIPGKTYYYRVRAFFGDATDYVAASVGSLTQPGSPLVFTEGNQRMLRAAPKMTLGRPSAVARGFVPRLLVDESGNSIAFNVYTGIFRAVQAGLLLNFDMPAAFPPGSGIQDTVFRNEQRTGWGTLGSVGGQAGPLKAAYPRSDELRESVVFKAMSRRLANKAATVLVETPELVDMLSSQWTQTVEDVVNRLVPGVSDLSSQEPWSFVGVVGGVTDEVAEKIEEYLAREEAYADGGELTGPVPLSPVAGATFVTVEERQALADFLRSSLSIVSTQTAYLSWYSLTVGDLFPALVPPVFDFEQFLLALLKAFESALQEIVDIIETLLTKIRALAQMLQILDDIIRILDVSVTVSVLAVGGTSGSADSLVQGLLSSEDKPGSSPFGLHSGMVMTFGGPGEGSVAALQALKFILGL